MNRKGKNLIFLAVLLLAILLLLLLIFREKEEYKKISREEENVSMLKEEMKIKKNKKIKKSLVKLYFRNTFSEAAPFKVITPEIREVESSEDYRDFSQVLFNELKKGPKDKKLIEIIPEKATLNQVYKVNSTLYLDFSSDIIPKNGGGIQDEIAIVYSIVNTFSENFLDVKSVKILIDGKERNTFLGHLDISDSLKASNEYVSGEITKGVIEEDNLK